MHKSVFTLGLALATAVSIGATANAQMMGSMPTSTFLKKSIMAGEQEVADAKAHLGDPNASVRYFAHRMITDHTNADDKLMALARRDGVAIPPNPGPGPMMSGKQYMHMQVAAHEEAVSLFKNESMNGTGQAKVLAGSILPVLEHHLAMAKQFQNSGHITMSSM